MRRLAKLNRKKDILWNHAVPGNWSSSILQLHFDWEAPGSQRNLKLLYELCLLTAQILQNQQIDWSASLEKSKCICHKSIVWALHEGHEHCLFGPYIKLIDGSASRTNPRRQINRWDLICCASLKWVMPPRTVPLHFKLCLLVKSYASFSGAVPSQTLRFQLGDGPASVLCCQTMQEKQRNGPESLCWSVNLLCSQTYLWWISVSSPGSDFANMGTLNDQSHSATVRMSFLQTEPFSLSAKRNCWYTQTLWTMRL